MTLIAAKAIRTVSSEIPSLSVWSSAYDED